MFTLRVMTSNLKFASAAPAPNCWEVRRPVTKEVIRLSGADVIGTQEGLYAQLKDMVSDAPEYDWIGLGRAGGSHDEFAAILYRKDRLEPLEFDHFWLSDTPNVVGSITWGHHNIRMTTWVLFRDRETGATFYHFNTHLDHLVQAAKEKGAALILERMAALDPKIPVVLTGDFNAVAEKDPAYEILTASGGLTDAWLAAKTRRSPDYGTWHDYRGPVEGEHRIDWILTRGPVVTETAEVLVHSVDGQYASDHFPVVATLSLLSAG